MRIIKIALTLLFLIGSINKDTQAHSIKAAIERCDTIRENRVNHVERDPYIREDRATDQMLDDIAEIEAVRNAAEFAAWSTYIKTMAGILTMY